MSPLRMIVLIVHLLDITSARNRHVRITHGEIVEGRTTGYEAVRYFAQIATLHKTWWFGFWQILAEYGIYGDVLCGGALITPGIVQTACHCLTFSENLDESYRIQYPEIKHNWESTYVVYVGVNREFGDDDHPWAMDRVSPLISKKFVIHQACGKLPKGSAEVMTHDFAWICVEPTWDPNDKLFERVDFAPLYTTDETDKIFAITRQRKYVCLIQGFGYIETGMLSRDRSLRHGWMVVISYESCVKASGYGIANLNRYDLVSWICTVPFKKHNQTTGEGDSGSPVTCNNYYVAVVLGRLTFDKEHEEPEIKKLLNLHSALKFAPFENTRAYRKAFIKEMAEYANSPVNYDTRSLVQSTDTYYALIHQQQRHLAPRSRSSSISKALPYCLLFETLVKFALFQ